MEADGRVMKQIRGRGYYASVRLTYEDAGGDGPPAVLAPGVENAWDREWFDAAVAGVALGLELARAPGRCTITRVHGMVCDTNPTLVAIAAVRAVWAAVSFDPDEATAQKIESCILRGHQMTPADLRRELGGDELFAPG